MGREIKTITLSVGVSRHNSEEDRLDDASLEWLRGMIEALANCEHAAGRFSYVDVSGP